MPSIFLPPPHPQIIYPLLDVLTGQKFRGVATTSSSMISSLPTIPVADVAKHNSEKSCYVTVGVRVYDVTGFLKGHPGGGDLILKYGGKDVTNIMANKDSHKHSQYAYDALNDLLIGHMVTKPVQDAIVQHDKPDDICPLLPIESGGEVINANGDAKKDTVTNNLVTTTGLSGPQDLYIATDEAKDWEHQKFLDLRKPLLMQVWRGNYSKEFYLRQVHRPRIIKRGVSPPLFGNFLEPLSLTPFWVVPLIWLPCVMYGVWKANTGLPAPLITALYFLTGLFLWTLVEYGMHRGLFHVDKYLPDNRVGITGHFLFHGIHHYLPMDKYRLVMPPTLFVVLAAPFHKLAHTVFYWDWYAATAVFCGGVFGYILYDETHYFLHHKTLPEFYRQLKAYHMAHHWQDAENGFGVTSRFWDTVFGTELAMSNAVKTA